MRILYVTRHFNHSGYLILKRLVEEQFNIVGVLFHDDDDPLRDDLYRETYTQDYFKLSAQYGFEPLKTLESEEAFAKSNGLNCLYFKSIKSDAFYNALQDLGPDIIVLGGGWHELLPERVYSYPRLGCINTHPSLLPEFRGTSITRWQIKYGVRQSGSSIHYVNDMFDTGAVLAQKKIVLGDYHTVTPQELFYKLGALGASMMPELLRRIDEAQAILPTLSVSHNEAYYSYFKKWTWNEDQLIVDWTRPLRNIHYFILSCTQEDYKYLGPIFYINKTKYFIRKTKLHPKDVMSIEVKGSGLVYVELPNGNVGLTSEVSDDVLELVQIQVYANSLKHEHIAFNPSEMLNPLLNTPFTNE
ncbi:hypothetical protein EVU94_11255 [Flavobacteriaceae bacterium 144Ye]|nr:hypothetical protein EVU94_11255 [Flavobacteriaceae bacterium 144Ye]